MNVFITHAEDDREVADELAKHLGPVGLVRLDDGSNGFLPFQKTDVVVALWSHNTLMSIRRLQLERRILSAWADERLVLVHLDHNILPVGLRDLPMIDASFVPARTSGTWIKIQHRVRETLNRLRLFDLSENEYTNAVAQALAAF